MKKPAYLLIILAAFAFAAPIRAQGLANFSSRMDVAPGGNYIVGFAVPGTAPVNLLLRAVGTPLQQFGVATGITAPNILVVDSKGNPRGFGTFGTQGVLGNPPGSASTLVTPVWSQLFAFAGAFPIPLNGTGAGYAFAAGSFNPGTYTVTITNAAGLGGTVLFELYVVPGPIPTID